MRLGRVPSGAKAPFCADCRSADCHVVSFPDGSIVWLCGSCEYLRCNPEAEKTRVPPGLPVTWSKRGKPQAETLF